MLAVVGLTHTAFGIRENRRRPGCRGAVEDLRIPALRSRLGWVSRSHSRCATDPTLAFHLREDKDWGKFAINQNIKTQKEN